MSWRKWKLSLIVASITGIFSGGVVAFVDPNINWKGLTFILLYNICQNGMLFLKDHPVDKITENTEIFYKKDENPKV